MDEGRMRRKCAYVTIGIGFLILLIAASLGFALWASVAAPAMPQALAALRSDEQVKVESGSWAVFRPASAKPAAGLILYPGGRVDWRAYAPAAHQIAACGNLVIIAPMPLNLAVFGKDSAQNIMAAYPEISTWVVGGHSLGGAMAVQFAHDHPAAVEGLLLWAAYPAENGSLAATGIKVLSVSGSLDGLATPEKIDASRALLPAGTRWLVIQGGNHAQFGWYGPQGGDHSAAISREIQQKEVVDSACQFMHEVNGDE